MPVTIRPSRSTLVILLAALSVLLAAVWLFSQFRGLAVLRTTAALVRIDSVPDGQLGAWEYTLTTWSFQSYPHQFRLVRGEYLSVMQREAEKDRFADQLGWEAHSFLGYNINPNRRPWFISEPANWRFLGFGTGESTGGGQTARTFDLPYWLLIVVFGAPALLAAKRHRKLANREKEGRCLECDYQLDANMTKCPECGTGRSAAGSVNH